MNDLFRQYQAPLLRVANNRFGRKFLGIDHEIKRDTKIVGLTPNSYVAETGRGFKKNGIWQKEYRMTVRGYPLFSRHLGLALTTLDIARDGLKYRRLPEYAGLLNYAGLTLDNRFPLILLASPETYYSNETGEGNVTTAGKATWTAARDPADGDQVNKTDGSQHIMGSKLAGPDFRAYRRFNNFDSSAVPDDANITACDYKSYYENAQSNADTTDIVAVANTQASSTDLVVADFDQLGATSIGTTRPTLASIAGSAAYFTIAIASGSLSLVSKTGYTKFGLRIGRDFDNSEPTGHNYATISTSYTAGTGQDPNIIITYTAAASGIPNKIYQLNQAVNRANTY